MLEALAACEPDPLLASPEPRQAGISPETRTLSMLSDLYDRELVNIISWAKLIPGKQESPSFINFTLKIK